MKFQQRIIAIILGVFLAAALIVAFIVVNQLDYYENT